MRTSAQTQMILWTLIAVFLGGIGVFASVMQPPQSIVFKQAKVETKIEADRAPASYSGVDIDDKGTQAIDFTLPCQERGSFSRNVAQVRLTGKLCGKVAKQAIESSEIRNMTNGFSATVFPGLKPNSFTTDYITLANGENHIRIMHILRTGARVEREFVIERN